jgi:thiamine pyrophosphokinase
VAFLVRLQLASEAQQNWQVELSPKQSVAGFETPIIPAGVSGMAQNIIIVSNGRFGDHIFFQKKIAAMENCLIICCDGGARHLQELGIKPAIIVGDMDSISFAQLENYKSKGIKVIQYPAEKDFTDTELALNYAIGLKPTAVYIWGALGGRIDHSLANVFLLCKGKDASIKTYLIDEYCEAFVIDKEAVFSGAEGQTVSIISLTVKVEGITLQGFLYKVKDAALTMGESLGISNIINEACATIRIRSGSLLVIHYWQKDIFPEDLHL